MRLFPTLASARSDRDFTLLGRYVETYAYADGRLDVRWKGYCAPYRRCISSSPGEHI